MAAHVSDWPPAGVTLEQPERPPQRAAAFLGRSEQTAAPRPSPGPAGGT